ncbi:hypothetical protein KJ557_03750 [Patescibacteria group bacterium]|nr:hypothetical protein [Patescibacteria group bacterium]MBU1956296.1 hypothetical protein [Patescibacteria group bacterium]
MNINQRGFANIVLVITIVVILVGAVGYFALRKPTTEPTISPTSNNTQPIQPQVTPPPTTNQTLPPPQAGMLRYQSSHGFSIDYLANWRYDSTIEKYGSVGEAEKVSGNHFSIYSYPVNNSYNPGAPVPQNEIKIETSVSSNVHRSLDEWINSLALENVLRTESISINGKSAKKILYGGEMGSILSIYYLDDGRKVIFTAYPSDTKYSQEFDAIVKTFRFTN